MRTETRQMRQNRRRRKAGRGRLGCLSTVFLAVLFIGVIVAAGVIFFKITRIDVTGNSRYSADAIREASEVELGDNLLILNKYTVTRHITEALPYVDEVHLSRGLPDTLIIGVTESEPVAFLQTGTSYWLIDAKGKLLEETSELPDTGIAVKAGDPVLPIAGKPIDFGEEGTDKQNALTEILRALEGEGMLGIVNSIDVSVPYRLSFRYDNRYTVELGILQELDYKLEYLKRIIDELTDNLTGTIDLTNLIEKQEARFIPD